jgi:trehalose-6-phosphatase
LGAQSLVNGGVSIDLDVVGVVEYVWIVDIGSAGNGLGDQSGHNLWIRIHIERRVVLSVRDLAVEAAGEQLRNAVLAQQGPIELKTGPINGKITHAQYNTPLNMYSDPQIVTTLVSQAVASGADINDPNVFNNANNIKVDTDSAVYKRLSTQEKSYASKQSRSFNILNTLLKHPYEPQNV